MTKLRARRRPQRVTPTTVHTPTLRLLALCAPAGQPSAQAIADQSPRRAASEPAGELLQFPRRDPDPPPIAA